MTRSFLAAVRSEMARLPNPAILRVAALCAVAAFAPPVHAGPPYVTDDPVPTDHRHYEIFLFDTGATTRDGTGGAYGVDFNYGAGPDLQLSVALPIAHERPAGGARVSGIGNIELAAKFRLLHGGPTGWQLAVFPRVFLPSGSKRIGDQQASLLLPVWVQKDWNEQLSTFGGGGYIITGGSNSRDIGLLSWALTYQFPRLQLGGEVYHTTPDTPGGLSTTATGMGARYDLTGTFHLLGYLSSALTNADQTNRLSWYSSLLLTF